MDTIAPLAMTIAGTLSVILISLAIALFRQMSKAITELTRAVVVLQTLMMGEKGAPGLADKVQSLHDWRNEMQKRELADAKQTIAELRRERGTA